MRLRQAVEVAGVVAKNALLGGNVLSLSLAKNPRGMARYTAETLFLYRSLTGTRGIPQRNVFQVLSSDEEAKPAIIGTPKNGGTWLKPSAWYAMDLVSLCLICQIIRPKVVFEIGTFEGYTAFHFGLNTPADAKVYTLDLPKDGSAVPQLKTTAVDDTHVSLHASYAAYSFTGSPVASKITPLFGDSATYDYSWAHGLVDLFFVDGAHSYEYVRSDTLNALKCCHPGSVIAWHDFGRAGVNGVSKWILELSRQHEIYCVPGGSLAYMVVK